MSSVYPTTAIAPPSSNNSTHPDLAALAASLHGIAQALLALSREDISPETEKPKAKLTPGQNDGEIRSCYFPPAWVNMERDLLRKYHAQDFQGLLEEAHIMLAGLVKLMQSVHKDVRVRGYVLSSLGAQIDHAAALLLRMRHVYEKVMPVQS